MWIIFKWCDLFIAAQASSKTLSTVGLIQDDVLGPFGHGSKSHCLGTGVFGCMFPAPLGFFVFTPPPF